MTSGGTAVGRGAKIVLAGCMTLMCFLILEVGVRVIGHRDQDGNFFVGQRQVLPLRLPVGRLESAVRQYRESGRALFVEDARLGWRPRPLAHNDLYAYDQAGLRSRTPDEAAVDRNGEAVRIAIFGDSFAHGSEVSFDESWGEKVRQALDTPARRVEVLNFGVPGYGMDQAYLRWEEDGRAYAPAIVVFGLQVENAGRNLNLLRVLYDSADLPFAKPRFVENGDGLDLINVPVPGPEQVVEIVRRIDEWPLVGHERYYEPDRYRDSLWRHLRLAGMTEALATGVTAGQRPGELPEEQRRLALRIIEMFARSVEATGARFVLVHFPRRVDLEQARADGRLPDVEFLDAVNQRAPVVRPDQALLARAGTGDLGPLFRPGGHYSPEGYALIAAAVAERLQAELAGSEQTAVHLVEPERTERILQE